MFYAQPPSLIAYLLQVFLLTAYIPVSYLIYRQARAPIKQEEMRQSLAQLELDDIDIARQMIQNSYMTKHFIGPLLLAYIVTFASYTLLHPYIINQGWATGFLEEMINVFGLDDPVRRLAVYSQVLSWGWLGAWVYSFYGLYQRLMRNDMNPQVYVFICNRFLLALVVSSVVVLGLGTYTTAAAVSSLDVNSTTASIVAFFIGFFPERGINWVSATARHALKFQGGISKEKNLAEIEGISIWQQGRLNQEGIENIQNLATSDITHLTLHTPFTLNQIIDWVDQAILVMYASNEAFQRLEGFGLRCASDVIVATSTEANLADLVDATQLKPSELRILAQTVKCALNIKMITRYRWRYSMNMEDCAVKSDQAVEGEIATGV